MVSNKHIKHTDKNTARLVELKSIKRGKLKNQTQIPQGQCFNSRIKIANFGLLN